MNYMNEHDQKAWTDLLSTDYTFEDIEPIRMICEAINERAAAVGEPGMEIPAIASPIQEGLFQAIREKIFYLKRKYSIDNCELWTHFGFPDSIYTTRNQYRAWPLKFYDYYDLLSCCDTSKFPMFMWGENNLLSAGFNDAQVELNSFYRACKFLLDRMHVVDVTNYSYVISCFDCQASYLYETEGDGSIPITSSEYINGERIDFVEKGRFLDLLSGTARNLSAANRHCSYEWTTSFQYLHEKQFQEYEDSDGEYHGGDWEDETIEIEFHDHPGVCRFQNPACFDGDLHLWLQPVNRISRTVNTYTPIEYTLRPGEYGKQQVWSIEHGESEITNLTGYSALGNSIYSGKQLIKQRVLYPQYYPLRDDVSALTNDYFYDLDDILYKSVDTYDPYRKMPEYGNTKMTYCDLYDGHGVWPLGTHDLNAGVIRKYGIKDYNFGNDVKFPSWISIRDLASTPVPSGWEYWEYPRRCTIDVNFSQRCIALIDYNRSFKYKDLNIH